MTLGVPLLDDRRDAGRRLGRLLLDAGRPPRPVVLGLARGGIAVAVEVARALDAPLDVVAVRKVGHPLEPEFAVGAVAPGCGVYVRGGEGLTPGELEGAVAEAAGRAAELDTRLHAEHGPVSLEGASAMVVDDGLATGATMIAACRCARSRGAERIVAAVPVAASASLELVRAEADEVAVLYELEPFVAVGLWYADFAAVEDADVLRLLDEAGDAGRQRVAR